MTVQTAQTPAETLTSQERQRLEDVGFMTCMTLVLFGNYNQTGHFGGPLAYTPFNVATHLVGPDQGGLRYDYRRPKHPYGDKFMSTLPLSMKVSRKLRNPPSMFRKCTLKIFLREPK